MAKVSSGSGLLYEILFGSVIPVSTPAQLMQLFIEMSHRGTMETASRQMSELLMLHSDQTPTLMTVYANAVAELVLTIATRECDETPKVAAAHCEMLIVLITELVRGRLQGIAAGEVDVIPFTAPKASATRQ